MLLDAMTFDGSPFKISLASSKPVGCGATAKIYSGTIVDDRQPLRVAVKVFGTMLDDNQQELLARELRAARQVSMRHSLILAFLGSASVGIQTAIVSLYMKNGNLLEYFKTHRESVDKIQMVADAVNYLHTVERLVHGDLKCANVLVSDFGDALLADFGLSTFVEKAQTGAATATAVRQMYTVRFAAPELLTDTAGGSPLRSKTRETDVYAFGMLIIEALSEQRPWPDLSDYAVIGRIGSGSPHPRPLDARTGEDICAAWWALCTGCCNALPPGRPSMAAVLAFMSIGCARCARCRFAGGGDEYLTLSETWDQLIVHPQISECDIDELCSLLTAKIHFSGRAAVIAQPDVDAVLDNIPRRAPSNQK